MNAENQQDLSYPHQLTQLTEVAQSINLSYPIETRMDKGFQAETVENGCESVSYPLSSNNTVFVTAKKAMLLMGCSWATIKRHCKNGKFKGAKKNRIDGTESWQIPITSLPPEAQAKHAAEMHAAIVARAAAIKPPVPAVQGNHAAIEIRAMWDAYERSGDATKKKAELHFAAVSMFEELTQKGFSKGHAEKEVLATHGVKKNSLWRARGMTDGHPKCEWLARLSPNWSGGRPHAECTPDAWIYILDAYLIPTKPPFAVVMEEARILAKVNGWTIPSNDAVMDKIKKLPADLVTLGRYGPKALERAQHAVKRSYDMPLHAVWESDGHRFRQIPIFHAGFRGVSSNMYHLEYQTH